MAVFAEVEVEHSQLGPSCGGNARGLAGGVVLEFVSRKGGIHKSAEFVDGVGQGNGYLVAVAFESHDSIAVVVGFEYLGNRAGTKERGVDGTTETAVIDHFVCRAMEEASGGRRGGVVQGAIAAQNGSGIRHYGGGTETARHIDGSGQAVGSAIVGLQHGNGSGARAGENDAGGIDAQLLGMGTKEVDGRGDILYGITYGRVEIGVHLEQRKLVGMAQKESVVDRNGNKSTVGEGLAGKGGRLVVTGTTEKTTTKNIQNASVVGSGGSGLIDIEL